MARYWDGRWALVGLEKARLEGEMYVEPHRSRSAPPHPCDPPITLNSWHCGVVRVRVSEFQGVLCKTYSYFSVFLADIQSRIRAF